MDEQPKNVKELLVESKDAAELMVDLAYAAVFFDEEKLAREVERLEERMNGNLRRLRTMAMLALSSAIYMGAIATSQAVVALHGHAQVAFGWILAMTAFLLTLWLGGDDLFRRIEIALVMSSLTALVAFSLALRWRFSIVQPDVAGDAGPLPELPLET